MPIVGCTELAIGASAATLLELRYRGIPAPDDYPYRAYSVTRTAGTGEPKSYGFPTASWSWETMDQMVVGKFLDFFAADTDAGVQVYITTYVDTGRSRTASNFTAFMHRPLDGEGKAIFPGSGGNVSQNVTISFTRLEAV